MKPVSLPLSPDVSLALRNKNLESLTSLKDRRERIRAELDKLDSLIEHSAIKSICGNADESQHVERYDGSLGVSRSFVDQHSPAIGQLQWSPYLYRTFTRPDWSQGNVQGVRWGTGGLISSNLFLTAGHCFHRTMGNWIRPSVNGQILPEVELAKLMQVNFNYQFKGHSNLLRDTDIFPVIELVDFQIEPIDFAIVRLGPNHRGELPGDKYGSLSLALSGPMDHGEMLCVIQHPNGSPKKIEAGPLLLDDGIRVQYNSIDTLGASSGSPILRAATGEIVGVHTNGGCTASSGANYGYSLQAIRKVSSIL